MYVHTYVSIYFKKVKVQPCRIAVRWAKERWEMKNHRFKLPHTYNTHLRFAGRQQPRKGCPFQRPVVARVECPHVIGWGTPLLESGVAGRSRGIREGQPQSRLHGTLSRSCSICPGGPCAVSEGAGTEEGWTKRAHGFISLEEGKREGARAGLLALAERALRVALGARGACPFPWAQNRAIPQPQSGGGKYVENRQLPQTSPRTFHPHREPHC